MGKPSTQLSSFSGRSKGGGSWIGCVLPCVVPSGECYGRNRIDLVESNCSLPLGGWLSHLRATACIPGSAPGSTLGYEYWKTYLFKFLQFSNEHFATHCKQYFYMTDAYTWYIVKLGDEDDNVSPTFVSSFIAYETLEVVRHVNGSEHCTNNSLNKPKYAISNKKTIFWREANPPSLLKLKAIPPTFAPQSPFISCTSWDKKNYLQ